MPTRDEFRAWAEAHGAQTRNSVTKQTTLLIVGEEFGRDKLQKAKARGLVTLHWYFLVALGITAERTRQGDFSAEARELVMKIALIMASICEDLYGQARTGSEQHRLAFERCGLALESLLQRAFGEDTGAATFRDEGSLGSPEDAGS